MINRILSVLAGLLCSFILEAQETCGFDVFHRKALATDSSYRRIIREQKEIIKKEIIKNKMARVAQPAAALYTIPVVVHIMHTGGAVGSAYNPTDAQILGAIADLNAIYDGTKAGTEGVGDMEIQFVLATRDPNCDPSTGITRTDVSAQAAYVSNGVNVNGTGGVSQNVIKNMIRWDPSKYYNIWVVNEIDNHDGTIGGSFIGGFAYLPGASPLLDGTVILASQMQANRKTLPHELGHAFGLYHPFEGGTTTVCPTNTDCTTDGDEVCDTDPITQPTTGVCRTGINTCMGGSTNYNINTEHNYMNYTGCATLFTAGQKARVLAVAGSVYRFSLNASWANQSTYPVSPFTAPAAASCSPTTGATGLSGYYAGVLGLELGGRVIISGSASQDLGYRNGTTDCMNLIQLTRGNTYNFNIAAVGNNNEQFRAWIDYTNNGVFDNATEQVYYGDDIPADPWNMTVTGSLTVPLTATINTILRMRVIDEVSTIYGAGLYITGGCYNPVYGQAEDYPVLLMEENLLPVKYSYVRATLQGRNVEIAWKTAEEVNADRFVIERATFGESFEPVGERAARGAQSGAGYSVIDADPGNGSWFYRIKQIDKDGRYGYSEVLPIKITEPASDRIRVLSNPFSSQIDLVLDKPMNEPASIRLVDMSGKVLLNRMVAPAGQTRLRIDVSSLQLKNGIYFLEYSSGGRRVVEKVMKQNH